VCADQETGEGRGVAQLAGSAAIMCWQAAGTAGGTRGSERSEGPAMESPELVAEVASRDSDLLQLGREPADRVEEVDAGPVSWARSSVLRFLNHV